MPNNFRDDELEPLPQNAQEAFANYPFPRPDNDFDARFWRELDNRKNRYRGLIGFGRRLVEIEIEGIAVWRLGFSMLGGAAFCALATGTLGARISPPISQNAANISLAANDIPRAAPRFARDWPIDSAPRQKPVSPRLLNPTNKPREVSCTRFANGLA